MNYSIRLSTKVFIRSSSLIVPYGILFLFSFGVLFYLQRVEPSAIDFLTMSLLLGTLGFLYFAFAGYEFTVLLRRNGGEESISAVKGATRKLVFSQVLVLLLLLTVWCVMIFAWQLVAYLACKISYPPYLLHCFLAVFLYCFLPGVIALLYGACLRKIYRATSYCLILLATLLCSPITTTSFSGRTLLGVSLASFFDWFSIAVPNSDWVGDAAYGVAMERSRWMLAAFWALLWLGILMQRFRANANKPYRFSSYACLFAAVLCGGCFALRGNDSIMEKDMRPDGMLKGEYNYRLEQEAAEELAADFSVTRYEMHFTVDAALRAEITMNLSAADLSVYRFTLYHGYQVSSVTDDAGNAVEYVREGDFLDIKPQDGTTTLTVCYYGEGGKYYANGQGAALPGYFAYYPIAGHRSLWDESNHVFAVNTEFSEKEFYVQVTAGRTYFSNLPQIGENTFEGVTDTVSLFAGLLEETEVEGVRYVYSPVSGQDFTIDLAEITNLWNELCAVTGAERELPLDDKIVIIEPSTIISASSGESESVVLLEDQILICGNEPSSELICYTYFAEGVPSSEETALLREAFLNQIFYSVYSVQVETAEKPQYDDLQLLIQYNDAGEITDVDEWSQYIYEKEVLFTNLMQYQISALGQETVLMKVYDYLTSESHSVNQVDFLYAMEENGND